MKKWERYRQTVFREMKKFGLGEENGKMGGGKELKKIDYSIDSFIIGYHERMGD